MILKIVRIIGFILVFCGVVFLALRFYNFTDAIVTQVIELRPYHGANGQIGQDVEVKSGSSRPCRIAVEFISLAGTKAGSVTHDYIKPCSYMFFPVKVGNNIKIQVSYNYLGESGPSIKVADPLRESGASLLIITIGIVMILSYKIIGVLRSRL